MIGTSTLANPAGTESYVLTVARELHRLGHEPCVTADELGPVADIAEGSGIPLARTAGELPASCDAVLAQDAMTAAALAARYPDARVVQVAHSDSFDHQLPLLVDGVVDAVIVMSDRIAARVRALPLDVPVIRLRQPVDTERFVALGPIRERPRRALILSHYLTGPRRRALVDAWQAAGVECVQVGAPGATSVDVVPAIADADIVVGKARAVLEGMSCERAAYVFDDYAGDGWVTPDAYASFEADAFAGFATPAPRTPADLARDLDGYDANMGWLNRELVKAHHAARRHAIELVDVLRGQASPARRPLDGLTEIARLTRANRDAERRALVLQREAVELRERTVAAEWTAERNDQLRAQAGEAAEDARVDAAAWRERAEEAERQAADARALLATRRARAGLAVGRSIDRVRGRR
ncbi:MAG: hypothetical protein QOJ12_1177 [Thermoleophilales bacterium]|nr:hypothetical protein [Thermoleophilales bacterium]